MPDPISWLYLTRDVNDTQTIEEAIDADILTHNLDPSAHGQTSEAIYEHRVAPLLDHLNYVIYNNKLNPAARTVIAICDSGGVGDFRTIQEAVDYANLYGGGTVHIKAGTYTLSADLTLYSNVNLEGDDEDLVIVKFSSNAYGVKIIGTSGTHKRNIEISKISFEGWADAAAWKNIELDYCDDVLFQRLKFTQAGAQTQFPYAIYANHSNRIKIEQCQSLEITCSYFFLNTKQSKVDDCYFYLCGGDCVGLQNADHSLIKDCLAQSCGTALVYDYGGSDKTKCRENTIIDCGDYAFYVLASNNWILQGNHITSTGSGYGGIALEDSNRNIIEGNEIYGLSNNGIDLINSDHNIIDDNVVYNNGAWGIDINDAASSKNILANNQVYSNSSGQINDSGTSTVNDNNVVTA